ncbi:hypothetical protein GGX14DRAFT_513778 [Mycena pura]|uniref:Amine oxidase domain-containing protein n=1 Tax=Mycena pura TaxID=153505 RepID=A0AAD6YM11_9AGAR|nr:hypothetical protein GGX14DRAFT_513778 [Mycena pura]
MSGSRAPRTVKVAVVGSGLAGLTTTYLLSSSLPDSDVAFEVHLFEKAPTLGMDSSSVSIGKDWRIDVPMRSFQGGYYPHFIALYTKLGVEFRLNDYSYSFSSFSQKSGPLQTTMIYNGASGRAGLGMPAWMQDLYFRRERHHTIMRIFGLALFILTTLQLFACYVRLILFSLPPVRSKRFNDLTFGEWAAETVPCNFFARVLGFDSAWKSFTQDVLIPLFSAVCTAPEEAINAHPVEDILDYIWLTFGRTHHYVVSKGVRDVVARLTSNAQHIHLSAHIVSVHADPSNPRLVSIECSTIDGPIRYPGFHHIVFGTQATRVGPMLSTYAASLPPDSHARDAAMQQMACLETFRYVRTVVLNHTDASPALLPADKRDRRDLNLVVATRCARAVPLPWSPHRVSLAYTMTTQIVTPPPVLRAAAPVTVFQTTNPFVAVPADRILSSATLERAVRTMDARAALRGLCRETRRAWWQCAAAADCALGPLQGAGRADSDAHAGVWLCGAYAHVGIPLLEGCVVSARNVYLAICDSEGLRPSSASCF